jgi:DNA-binding beta-propeller fold protein YncE
MFSVFAKLFRSSIASLLLTAPLFTAAAQSGTAKGGSLTVRTNDGRKLFTLSAEAHWFLEATNRFDASALAFHNSKLITVNDQRGEFFHIDLRENSSAALQPLPLFPKPALAQLAPKPATRFDLEGIAIDQAGNIYVCEESQRLVFKFVRSTGRIQALSFDWSPVSKFFTSDLNASFEGIAVAGPRLYLANERSNPRIIVIDLPSQKVIDSFFVSSERFAFGGPHYSDLAFFEGHLFILDRNHRCIYQVDPETRSVLAEFSFAPLELAPQFAYRSDYPTGTMEGLAVENDFFWLLTDNNGKGRIQAPRDIRPALFRCRRPDLFKPTGR